MFRGGDYVDNPKTPKTQKPKTPYYTIVLYIFELRKKL